MAAKSVETVLETLLPFQSGNLMECYRIVNNAIKIFAAINFLGFSVTWRRIPADEIMKMGEKCGRRASMEL
jgi:hypothetical protein